MWVLRICVGPRGLYTWRKKTFQGYRTWFRESFFWNKSGQCRTLQNMGKTRVVLIMHVRCCWHLFNIQKKDQVSTPKKKKKKINNIRLKNDRKQMNTYTNLESHREFPVWRYRWTYNKDMESLKIIASPFYMEASRDAYDWLIVIVWIPIYSRGEWTIKIIRESCTGAWCVSSYSRGLMTVLFTLVCQFGTGALNIRYNIYRVIFLHGCG